MNPVLKRNGKIVLILFLIIPLLVSCGNLTGNKYKNIFQAIDNNDLDYVTTAVRKNPLLLKSEKIKVNEILFEQPSNPLTYAIENKKYDMAAFLAKNGCDVNYRSSLPLFTAIKQRDLKLVNILIENKADVNVKSEITRMNSIQQAPLHIAAGNNDMAIVNALLKAKADPNILTSGDYTPLHEIAEDPGKIEIAYTLLNAGADVNLVDRYGETPLYLATKGNNIELVRKLLDSNANKEIHPSGSQKPLILAFNNGYMDIVRAFEETDSSIKILDASVDTSSYGYYGDFAAEKTRKCISEIRALKDADDKRIYYCVKFNTDDMGDFNIGNSRLYMRFYDDNGCFNYSLTQNLSEFIKDFSELTYGISFYSYNLDSSVFERVKRVEIRFYD